MVRNITITVIGVAPVSVLVDAIVEQIVVGGFPAHVNVTIPVDPAEGVTIIVNLAVSPGTIDTCVPVPGAGKIDTKLVVGVSPIPLNETSVGLPV